MLSHLCTMGFLRFTSGVTPADLVMASIAASHVSYMHLGEVGILLQIRTSDLQTAPLTPPPPHQETEKCIICYLVLFIGLFSN